jgi:hypothetical protein
MKQKSLKNGNKGETFFHKKVLDFVGKKQNKN